MKTKVDIRLYVEPKLKKAVESLAAKEDRSVNNYVVRILESHIKSIGK